MFRIVISLSALLLVASIAPAQSTSSPFICQTSAGVPPVVRAESRTEMVGDYVVMCSGRYAGAAGHREFHDVSEYERHQPRAIG